ncbi:hypothetical protein [Yersinia mollaretii]|uniref:hypothetical protein n=1 Tax=Yersinia mollaretii TaxID=33060 RepID=UPI0011A4F54D|nr:hypothetical protein [Yersinia mollaretii]
MLFNNQDWKLSVTDINLYENTVSLDGQSYPLSLALKTLIPGYVSGFSPRQAAPLEVLEALAEAGVTISNFFSKDLMSAYRLRQQAKTKAAAEAAETVRIQAERMAELNMTPEERLAAAQKRDQQKAERQAYGESIRIAVSSSGRSLASKLVEIDGMDNWMDSL